MPGGERRCTAVSKQTGERCRQPVADPRITVCRYHGGATFDRARGVWLGRNERNRTVTARYSQAVANIPQLEEMYQRVLEEPDMMETAEELALGRAYLARLMEKGTNAVVSGEMIDKIMGALDTIDKMVTRRHKRLHDQALVITARDWEALVTRVLDISHDYFGESPRFVPFVKAVMQMNQPRETQINWRHPILPPLEPPAAVVEATEETEA